MIRLQRDPVRIEPLLEAVRSDADGAVALFLGCVRDHNAGERVLYLEYEAYEPMAERELRRIAEGAEAQEGVSAVAVTHRLGRLEIGEVAVAVAVSAPHRAHAFEVCRAVMDEIKRTVPIWKREHTERGAVWIEGCDRAPAEARSDEPG